MCKRLLKLMVLFSLSFGLIACTQGPVKSTNNLTVSIIMPESHRITFSGKGAAAGMMLSSSMGPMGVAIGIAIDEGIAKEIHQIAESANLNFARLLEESLIQQASQTGISLNFSDKKDDVDYIFHVKQYGFLSQSGKDDPVAAKIHLRIEPGMSQEFLNTEIEFRYPENFVSEEDILLLQPLEDVKTDSQVIVKLWRDALMRISNKAIAEFQRD